MRKDSFKEKFKQTLTSHGESNYTRKKRIILIVSLFFVLLGIIAALYYRSLPKLFTDEFPEVDLEKSRVIDYTGSCMCPTDKDAAGKLCGERSAWSKGSVVVCYDKDGNLLKR